MELDYRALIQRHRALFDGLHMTILIFIMSLASGEGISLLVCMGTMKGGASSEAVQMRSLSVGQPSQIEELRR